MECAIPDVEGLNCRAPLKNELRVACAFGIAKRFLSEAFCRNVCEKKVVQSRVSYLS